MAPELTASEEWALVVPPCADCGDASGPDMTDEEAQKALDRHAALEKTEHGRDLNKAIASLNYLCERCMQNRENRDAEGRRQMHVSAVYRNTFGRELLPRSAKDQTFESSKPNVEALNPKPWEWAKSWKPASGNAWFFGLEGRGKTYLTRAMAMQELAKGRTVGEVSAFTFIRGSTDFKWDEHRTRLERVHFLIVEDIDKATWTQLSLEAFWHLVDCRADAKRRMVITSNAPPDYMIGNKRGVRGKWEDTHANSSMAHTIAARLIPCQRWELKGESLRRRPQNEETE